eukprot:TRINITY_DN28695_c0_g2_i1.p1 TRINITY_DN28695_c0_g2~~TRINITY_DN28695_c0_g2_i1.p1  ORF type:complete len:368 (+),score=79.71 TRINITY_DN28695_c0_g2_i1:83-1105(+)
MSTSWSSGSQSQPGTVTKQKVIHQLTKTTLCDFFAAGGCPAGRHCKFAHGEQELQAKPNLSKTSICKAWKRGACRKSAATCHFAHGYSDLRTTAPFDPLHRGQVEEDPRKKRAEFWKRVNQKNREAASMARRSAAEWRLEAEENEVAVQQFRGIVASMEEAEAAAALPVVGPSAQVADDAIPRGLGPNAVGHTVAMTWTMPSADKVRWADLDDDDEDELSSSDLAFSPLSMSWPSSTSATQVKMHEEVGLQKGLQDSQPCDFDSNHMLEAGKQAIDQNMVTVSCCGGTTLPLQQQRVLMVPFVFREQYFVPPLMCQSSSSSSTFSATFHDVRTPVMPLED